MRKYLIGAAITAAVFVGASFAWAPERAAAAKNAPLRLADLTLDRRVVLPFSMVGNGSNVSLPFPAYAGLVIDKSEAPNIGSASMFIEINGVSYGSYSFQAPTGLRPELHFSHPIVVRPGDIVNISLWASSSNTFNLILSGWQVYPGEA